MPEATWLVRVEPGYKLILAYCQVSAHDYTVFPSSRTCVCVYVCVCVCAQLSGSDTQNGL